MGLTYLLLGSNIGDKLTYLKEALHLLRNCGKIKAQSSVYVTEPWGFKDERYFYNMAVLLETSLAPDELLKEIFYIETSLGRIKRENQWSAREIDIDILFYDDLVINTADLIIPHSLISERNFALFPMNEIASSYCHPVLKKSISTLVEECEDTCQVNILNQTSFY